MVSTTTGYDVIVERRPDVTLVDVNLGSENGFELA
jgi:hypothetical protein